MYFLSNLFYYFFFFAIQKFRIPKLSVAKFCEKIIFIFNSHQFLKPVTFKKDFSKIDILTMTILAKAKFR